MPKSKSRPENAIHVRTYAELDRYACAFAEGHLNFVMILGPPGVGKSRQFRGAVGPDVHWIDGNATAFGIYIQAYENRGAPIVLDDVDGLYRDRNGIRLLKSLCQSEPRKTLSWCSDARTLDKQDIPKQVTTTSRAAIIANEWKTLSADVLALEDRGHVIYFDPSPLEVHRQAATWFWDQEVFDFVAEHLHLFDRHSLRTYILAWEQKNASLDWRQGVLTRCTSGKTLEVAKLKADRQYANEEDRARAFVGSKLGCRSTYFNYAHKLRPSESVESITLAHSQPPEPQESEEGVLDVCEEPGNV